MVYVRPRRSFPLNVLSDDWKAYYEYTEGDFRAACEALARNTHADESDETNGYWRFWWD